MCVCVCVYMCVYMCYMLICVKFYNLYTAVISNKRGQKTAVINLRYQVGMKHNSMSNMGLHKTHMPIFTIY